MPKSYNSHSRAIHLEVDGEEIEFEVFFSIDSFGSADSFYEPGDPAEIVIEQIFRTGVYIGPYEVDVTDWAYRTHYSWNVSIQRVENWQRSVNRWRRALFGEQAFVAGPVDRHYLKDSVAVVRVNPQTVAEALEQEILENISDYYPEPDYDAYYPMDTRGEYDV